MRCCAPPPPLGSTWTINRAANLIQQLNLGKTKQDKQELAVCVCVTWNVIKDRGERRKKDQKEEL